VFSRQHHCIAQGSAFKVGLVVSVGLKHIVTELRLGIMLDTNARLASGCTHVSLSALFELQIER